MWRRPDATRARGLVVLQVALACGGRSVGPGGAADGTGGTTATCGVPSGGSAGADIDALTAASCEPFAANVLAECTDFFAPYTRCARLYGPMYLLGCKTEVEALFCCAATAPLIRSCDSFDFARVGCEEEEVAANDCLRASSDADQCTVVPSVDLSGGCAEGLFAFSCLSPIPERCTALPHPDGVIVNACCPPFPD